MKNQAIVVGLGQFGMSVARTLAERGVEVLAVDVQEDRVRVAASFVAEGTAKPDARVHCSICPDKLRVGAPAMTASKSVAYLAAAFSAPRPPLEQPW